MKTKTVAFLVGVVVFAVAVAVTLAVGVATHDEPGFMPDAPQWERSDFPLRVCGKRYTAEGPAPLDGSQSRTLGYVTRKINARLNFAALEDADDRCEIDVTLNAPPADDWRDGGGDAQLVSTDGKAKGCLIRVGNVPSDDLRAMVIEHEIGHCLGLAHDDFELSIMRPVQSATRNRTIPPWITDFDRKLLRERYAP